MKNQSVLFRFGVLGLPQAKPRSNVLFPLVGSPRRPAGEVNFIDRPHPSPLVRVAARDLIIKTFDGSMALQIPPISDFARV